MLFTILTILHVLVCLFLIGVVLLQSGKAADIAAAFGGQGSQTAFGPRGATTLLHKLTTGSAIVFMVTSLSLSIMATRGDKGTSTVLDKAKPAAPKSSTAPAPQLPGQTAPGQPSISIGTEGGQKTTIPLPMPPAPSQQAPAHQQQPAQKEKK